MLSRVSVFSRGVRERADKIMNTWFICWILSSCVAITMKDAAMGIRNGMQAALQRRHSRLSVELPPGAVLAVKDRPENVQSQSEHDKVRRGDLVLAEYVSLLFPPDFSVVKVFVDPTSANKAKSQQLPLPKKRRHNAAARAKGFGGNKGSKNEWCPALGLSQRCDVVLIVGAITESAHLDAVADADRTLGYDTALVLLNPRLPTLTAFPPKTATDNALAVAVRFIPAFSLSPPPQLDEELPHAELFDRLVAYRVFPNDWILALKENPTGFVGSLRSTAAQLTATSSFSARQLWTGDHPPTANDTAHVIRECIFN